MSESRILIIVTIAISIFAVGFAWYAWTEHVTWTAGAVADSPNAMVVTIYTHRERRPTAIKIECDNPIDKVMITRGVIYQSEYLPPHGRTVFIQWDDPPVPPGMPLVVTLVGEQPLSIVDVRVAERFRTGL